MGFLDQLTETSKSILGEVKGAGDASDLIKGALGQAGIGGLQDVVNQLRDGGLEEQVKSWLGKGDNMPVTAEDLRTALGNSQIAQLAKQMGLPVDPALGLLAQFLPMMIDRASPNGTVEASSSDDRQT